MTSIGYSLIGNGSGSTLPTGSTGNLVGTATSPIDPKLGPLQANGGPTQTMALLLGSPAIDAGSNSKIPTGVTTDQRGDSRISGGTVDIGAYEVQKPVLSITLAKATHGVAYSQTITATETGGAGGPYTYAVTTGTLPAGLSLTSAGVLGGNPTAAGTFTFTVTATDSAGFKGSQAYSFVVL